MRIGQELEATLPLEDFRTRTVTTNQIEILPVVNRADVHKLEGILTLRDVLDAYGVSARDRA